MAVRMVYSAVDKAPYFKATEVEFQFYNGFALAQKQKSINSLHNAYMFKNPSSKILEVSRKSEKLIGNELSAFNLMYRIEDKLYPVEVLFQGSKVFEGNIQYRDIYDKTPIEAKRDERLKNSGSISCFRLFDEEFPIIPRDFFYCWLYTKAVYARPELINELKDYDSFTDIEFNPAKSINCQAIATARLVGMLKANVLDEALKSKENFLKIVYAIGSEEKIVSVTDAPKSLFDLP